MIIANKKASRLRLIANGPTIHCTRLAKSNPGQHSLQIVVSITDLQEKEHWLLKQRHTGFDHRAGRFRPPDMATGILKLPILQWYRYFYLERRLLGRPTP